MIYITQLIFVKEGQEAKFLEFEDYVIPLMEKYSGQVVYRVRPNQASFVDPKGELPYEIHFVSFDSEEQLQQYMQDNNRLQYTHLKDESVKSILLVKGKKM